ncbi:F-box/kelch-repeat protein-like protein [Tanacetum coccineum]
MFNNTMSNYICEDLMVNIFERLPPKTVLRFRTLLKYWCSRLANRDFIRMHNLRSFDKNSSQKVLFRHRFDNPYNEFKDIFTLHSVGKLPLDPKDVTRVEFPYDIRNAKIVGSCNGILCLNDKGSICLWNFSIRRKLNVPRHPPFKGSILVPDVLFGFGFDPISNDYKIVGISYTGYGNIPDGDNAYIYSLKTDSWSVMASPSNSFCYADQNPCFFKGTLHWLVRDKRSQFIMTLSLITHVFGTINLPESNSDTKSLTIINGSLAAVSLDHDTRIWVMNEYDNIASWSQAFKLETGRLMSVVIVQPIINGVLILYGDKGCQVYNPQTGSLTNLFKFGIYCGQVELETYVESLELLDKGIACGITTLSQTNKRKYTPLG